MAKVTVQKAVVSLADDGSLYVECLPVPLVTEVQKAAVVRVGDTQTVICQPVS